jgi:PAS domain S-box-containing protein
MDVGMSLVRRALSRRLHFATCLAAMAGTSALVFSPFGQPWAQPFCLMPVLGWAALAFTWRGTVSALAIMLAAATVGTNPYAMRISDPNFAGLVLLQALMIASGFSVALAFFMSTQRRTAAKMRDLIETVDLGIFMSRELDGKILFWSGGAQQLYGFTPEEAVGQNSHALLQTVFPVPLEEINATVLRDGEWIGDLHHTTKDGRRLIVVARKVKRPLPNGGVITLLEILHDVTLERRDQAALVELTRTLEQHVEAEVAKRQEAHRRARSAHHMAALGKLSAGVAHEFNNILQAVVGGLECIASEPGNVARVSRFSRLALSATERGSVITSRLLAYAGGTAFHPERIEPALLLDALRDVLAHSLGGRVCVCLDLEPVLPPLVVDKAELETAIINLATNARDAMPEGGTLTLSAYTETNPEGLAPGRYIRIALTDRGTGMDEATKRRSIEPFFTTKPIGAGTGLGLSMVKGFAEQSGGGIHIDSTPGEGTTVSFWLPTPEQEAQPAPQRPATTTVAVANQFGTRVLFVDDESMVREALGEGLGAAGFAVVLAQSGSEALALLDAGEAFDVIVSDFAMPGMDGLTLLREAQSRRPGLPGLILTGYIESLQSDDILSNALSVLRKPIGAAALASSINAALVLSRNGSGGAAP